MKTAGGKQVGDQPPFNLIVPENDRVTLSRNIEQFKPYYKTLNPTTADEIKEVFGVPKDVSFSRPRILPPQLTNRIISIADLNDPVQSMSSVSTVKLATREYILGDHNLVDQWAGVINYWLGTVEPNLHLAVLNDIVINDGAVLHVAADTHSLQADSIKMYGSGSIEAENDLTIDCTSLEGYLSTLPSDGGGGGGYTPPSGGHPGPVKAR
jgi:hypothetical protein